MKRKRMIAVAAMLGAVPGWLAFLASLMLASCMTGDRLAGSSTEAGNAGGKLSLSNGSPAAGVSVALVARTYVPDTTGVAEGDRPGEYYRTRTGADGRFLLEGVKPGTYRVMAVDGSRGLMADSVVVRGGPDTVTVEDTLKPLGALRGVAKLVGSDEKVNLWVRPVATLKTPPVADSVGTFRLDSLPEGQYELVPQCFSCAPVDTIYRIWVKAGHDTLMPDTLKLFPGYFHGFPDSGEFEIPSRRLPYPVGGKTNRGENDRVLPSEARWTWNGAPVQGLNVRSDRGVTDASLLVDSLLLAGATEGRLSLTLVFPDTVVTRAWTIRIDRQEGAWPLLAVEADSAVRINGPEETVKAVSRWRFRVADQRALEAADVAFWGLSDLDRAGDPQPPGGPRWISLAVSTPESVVVAGSGPRRLTFILVPDSVFGGRVFRARRDERLEDFGHIRLLDRARLGFRDSLVPSMRPEGLILDRIRGSFLRQRYRVDLSGEVSEILGALAAPGDTAALPQPLLFWRSGDAGAGFAWDKPTRDAARSLAVTREGRAFRLDAADTPVDLPAVEMEALEAMLGQLAANPPGRPDTSAVPASGTLDYLRYRDRGLMLPSAAGDTLLQAFRQWLQRNLLAGSAPAFPLGDAVWRFESFAIDPGYRHTGDTLLLEFAAGEGGVAEVRESLSAGSPSRLAGDTARLAYRLHQDGDSLMAQAGGAGVASRILGSIGMRRALFAVAGLRKVTVAFKDGLPILESGGSILAGRLEGDLVGWGKVLASPGILLDGRGIETGGQGMGFLYTRETGLERAWRFGGRSKVVTGWNRL